MLLAVELVKDRQLKTPAKAEMFQIMEQMKGLVQTYMLIMYT